MDISIAYQKGCGISYIALLTLDLDIDNTMLDRVNYKDLRLREWFAAFILAMGLIFFSGFGWAHEHKKPKHTMKHQVQESKDGLKVLNAWVRETTPRANNGAAYATIINDSTTPNALIAVTTPAAEKVELHTHKLDNGVVKMRRIPDITIPGHGSAKLQPGGDHMMLIGLKHSLRAGDHITLTFMFRTQDQTTLKVLVMKKSGQKKSKHNH